MEDLNIQVITEIHNRKKMGINGAINILKSAAKFQKEETIE